MTILGLLVLCATATLSLVLTPAFRRLARRHGLVDHPDTTRKMHTAAVPRLGGLAVYVSFLIGSVAALHVGGAFRLPVLDGASLSLLLAAGTGVMLVGLADDLWGTSPWPKIVVPSAAALCLWHGGYRLEMLSNPFGDPVGLGVAALPLTVMWFVGLSNAFNLVDGLDGLAAGITVVASLTLSALAAVNGQPEATVVALALGGAALGFLRYNVSPASIFLGDCGSLFVGFVLAALSIRASLQPSGAVALWEPLLVLALPIADTLLAVWRRLLRRCSIFQADTDHIHHRVVQRSRSVRRALLILYGVTTVASLLALLTLVGSRILVGLAVFGGATAGAMAMRRLGYPLPRDSRASASRMTARAESGP